jgi:hypothetical protein
VSALTPESAVVSGAIDTGGDPAVNFNASAANPFQVGGLTVTANAILNGIPVGLGFYSTALFEADPLSDYIASGNQPGGETVTAPVEEVPTATGLSAVSAEIGAYPAASSVGGQPLTPGTKYVYWVVQQAGETDAATTVNEYDSRDLADWVSGTGKIYAAGFASASNVGANTYAAWAAGTAKYAGDPTDPTTIPGTIVNPDFACVLNTAIAANSDPYWTTELAANSVPTTAGSTTIPPANGTALPNGVASVSASGTFTATAKAQPAEQGPCVTFYGGNSTNFYTSAVGQFTTPPLGKIVIGRRGAVAARHALIPVSDRSVERAAGTIALTVGKGKTVASGRFSVPAGATGVASLKLTGKGVALFASSHHLVAKVTVTSSTDQPTSGKTVTLR